MESRRASRIRTLVWICLLFLVSLDFGIDQKLCLESNEVKKWERWRMTVIVGLTTKRIVDSEVNFSESSQSWAVGNLLERE